ncbi:hypothetical protein HPB49_004108 [Dermacentor silvarum]|uniref:Uncharacterized protein n=1 Tax=Dermacentor silvarum TaxID=543639 RepID=A0ACB8DTW6_DERSI|nr:hypothetical protein HPB49_004108 [Dermacentor silvarum]
MNAEQTRGHRGCSGQASETNAPSEALLRPVASNASSGDPGRRDANLAKMARNQSEGSGGCSTVDVSVEPEHAHNRQLSKDEDGGWQTSADVHTCCSSYAHMTKKHQENEMTKGTCAKLV